MGIKRTIRRNANAAAVNSIVTIGDAYARFEAQKRADGREECTIKNYKQSLNYFMEYCGFTDTTDIKQVDKDCFTDWKTDLATAGVSVSGINHYLRDCRAFFNWCMKDEQKYLSHFTIDMVSGDTPQKKLFSQSDLDLLLKKPASTDDMAFTEWRTWAVVNLAYDMGARAGSIVAICMEDIDLKNCTVYLRHTKNKSLATMKISTVCAKALKEYINNYRNNAQPQEALFCNVAGDPLTYNALAHSFTTYCKSRGVNQYNLHGLRHSFATAFAQTSNGDMVKLQKALGHKSITMSQHYVDTASVNMGDYNAVSPLAAKKSNAGAPSRKVRKAG